MLFGDVVNKEMVLNEWGRVAEREWQKTEEIRKNIKIPSTLFRLHSITTLRAGDQYAIMPNHLHGIIGILEEPSPEVRAYCNTPQPSDPQPPILKSPSKTIGAIIRGFKSSVTKKINIERNTLGAAVWQRNYFERIIRDEPELNRIRKYIIENPFKWQDDKYFI